jgi:thiosulfate/3-mercaptopyruvate sulfurtransferase
MSDTFPTDLVDTPWLAAHLSDPAVRILDATLVVPPSPRKPREEFAAAHIPGAQFFDIDAVSDKTSALPHMLPPPAEFAAAVGALGIGNEHTVVVYDGNLMMGAARAWWMFRVFGHTAVAVLDGGIGKWQREQRIVTRDVAAPERATFVARFDGGLVRSKAQVEANLAARREKVVDARSAGRFAGTEPEPRPGLRGGHIPESVNVPFTTLIDPATQTMLPRDALEAAFARANVGAEDAVVASCGSGVTACVVALALHRLGRRRVAVYDGSWAEWGRIE